MGQMHGTGADPSRTCGRAWAAGRACPTARARGIAALLARLPPPCPSSPRVRLACRLPARSCMPSPCAWPATSTRPLAASSPATRQRSHTRQAPAAPLRGPAPGGRGTQSPPLSCCRGPLLLLRQACCTHPAPCAPSILRRHTRTRTCTPPPPVPPLQALNTLARLVCNVADCANEVRRRRPAAAACCCWSWPAAALTPWDGSRTAIALPLYHCRWSGTARSR